jgi:hypothetical protein
MNKRIIICSLAAGVALATASAKEFPLEFKSLKTEEVMKFPGGAGMYGLVRAQKPANLDKEPKAASDNPLYGQLGEATTNRFLFRLDESKGTGKGYDRLIVDLNQNRDLTDDPVVSLAPESVQPKVLSGSVQKLFGPIEPSAKTGEKARAAYYAEMYLYNLRALTNRTSLPSGAALSIYMGQLRLRAGYYLETTVAMDGVKQRIGIFDADTNLRLNDPMTPRIYESGTNKQWYFSGGDLFLQDVENSGSFESDPLGTGTSPFSSVLYLGPTPYKASLSADQKSLKVEPYDGLATLSIKPKGSQVQSLSLAREAVPDQWELIKVNVANGKAKIPPGKYRLYQVNLAVKPGTADQLLVGGYQRYMKEPMVAEAGRTIELSCAAPLELKLTTSKDTSVSSAVVPAGSGLTKSDYTLRIAGQIVGQDGEVYSSFIKGRTTGTMNVLGQPSPPTFKVLGPDGKEVASGNMEFG